jgi:UDP-N-acetylmuramoyl-tripeptide--D-alanyl-D-alanine ligase
MHGGDPEAIARSLRIVKPSIAVVTTIAEEHISTFVDLKSIAQEKTKLVAALPPHRVAVLNVDDPHVLKMKDHTSSHII